MLPPSLESTAPHPIVNAFDPPRFDHQPSHVTMATLFRLFEGTRYRHSNGDSVRNACEDLALHLPCHTILGADGTPYLKRYGVADMGDGGHVYLHHIMRPDQSVELHNHPWGARALILAGGYREERRVSDLVSPTGYRIELADYEPGDTNTISPDTFHRIDSMVASSTWTILITGPKASRAIGEPSWSFWDRATGVQTGYKEFLAAKGLEGNSTPQNLATGNVTSQSVPR